MDNKLLKLEKITDTKWFNLFHLKYRNVKNKIVSWYFASRRQKFDENSDTPDAIVIVPLKKNDGEDGEYKLVLIKEFRPPVFDYVYSVPAGLLAKNETIENCVKRELKEETGLEFEKLLYKSPLCYSAPGIVDESCIINFVEASGELSNEGQEEAEDVKPFYVGMKEIKELLSSSKKMDMKCWAILYNFYNLGEIGIYNPCRL